MQKVLIITYYWPPAGGPGVQRWLKFVKYLQQYNIEPVLYIPENPNYPLRDEALEKEVPHQIKYYKHKIFEPYRFASLISKRKTKDISSGIIPTKKQGLIDRLLLWVRGNLFIPDARKYWVRPSINYLKDIIENEGFKTIITTGPPHSTHLIGLGLKAQLNLRWIADFRDPWTSIGYHSKLKLTKSAAKKHKAMEKKVLMSADTIITTSSTTKKEFEISTRQPIEVITNGFDIEPGSIKELDSSFTIAHIGSLLSGRNPENLWKAMSALIKQYPSFESALKLQFAGVVGEDVKESIRANGLAKYAEFLGYISHEAAIELQRKCQILLLIEINSEETKGIIPGKLFEYMASGRPILAIGPHDWEAGEIVKATNTGCVFNYQSIEEIKELLLQWFDQFSSGKLELNSNSIEHYSRRSLTKQLAELLKNKPRMDESTAGLNN
jgi:glycosyltransferase involved in cell wall biosynthesis